MNIQQAESYLLNCPLSQNSLSLFMSPEIISNYKTEAEFVAAQNLDIPQINQALKILLAAEKDRSQVNEKRVLWWNLIRNVATKHRDLRWAVDELWRR